MSTLFGGKRKQRQRSRPVAAAEVTSADGATSWATHSAGLAVEKEIDGGKNDDNRVKPKEGIEGESLATNKQNQSQSGGQDGDATTTDFATTFADLGLCEPLVATCRQLGLIRPTPVQRTLIPYLLQSRTAASAVLALASTGSGKTAAYVLPILHKMAWDPFPLYALVLCPTRELAKQVHQHVVALGHAHGVTCQLVVGGMDAVQQSCKMQHAKPHLMVATPGRFARLLQGPAPRPSLQRLRFLVLDEADRLLASNSGFERDVALVLAQCRSGPRPTTAEPCQTLLLSATLTQPLQRLEEMVLERGQELRKFVISQDNKDEDEGQQQTSSATASTKHKKQKTLSSDDEEEEEEETDQNNNTKKDSIVSKLPAGLKQEYIFMPSRVRNAYLLTVLRTLMVNGGRTNKQPDNNKKRKGSAKSARGGRGEDLNDNDDDEDSFQKARSAIVFVSTCERAALVSGILSQVGVPNVALHSLLSQHKRFAALGSFKSQHVSVLVATDVASRGLDIPTVDLVVNSELPRQPVNYVHRVGRTARAGRRGRAVSLVAETDVALVQAVERVTGRSLEKCQQVTEDMVLPLLGPAAKATRLTKMKLADIGFDELVQKFKERKARDAKERKLLARRLARMEKEQSSTG